MPHVVKHVSDVMNWSLLVIATVIILLSLIWCLFWARNYSGFTLNIDIRGAALSACTVCVPNTRLLQSMAMDRCQKR